MERIASQGLIGVDGGGTSCRLALRCDGRRVEVRAGGANVQSDEAAAVRTIGDGLSKLAAKAGIPLSDMRCFPAHLGLAGVLTDAKAQAVARQLPLDCATVSDDRGPAVVGALGDRDGVVLGIGTGSFFARQVNGVVTLTGGWGLILGDEASGAYLGRRLLQSTLHAVDGLRDATQLTRAIMARFADTAASLVEFAASASPRDFAELAPLIVDSAKRHDPVAVELLREGAAFIQQNIRRLGWQSPEPICALGGLAPHYRDALPPALARAFVDPAGSALDGALTLASRRQETEFPG